MPACHCLAIRQAARQVTQLYDGHLAAIGLRSTQYAVLRMLAPLQPATMQRLADALVMDRTTLTRGLRPLQDLGLVRVEAGRDGRTRVVTLTASGAARLEQAHTLWKAAQTAFETRLGTNEAGALHATLAHLVTRLGPPDGGAGASG